jgi:hypothetical protein
MLARLVVPWDPGNSVGFDDKPRHDVPPSGHGVTTSRSSPRPGLARGSDRAARPHNLGSSSGGALRPDAALLTLQRGAGNRAVTRLMAAQGLGPVVGAVQLPGVVVEGGQLGPEGPGVLWRVTAVQPW